MIKDFYETIEERRSIYEISKEAAIDDDALEKMIKRIVKTMPSAMNSQSARVILLLGEHNDEFWRITEAELRKIVDEKRFEATKLKLKGFAAGRGTILFFEDLEVTNDLANRYPTYKDNFHVWGQQANGMLQFAIWSGLRLEGYGASLQHYTEVIEKEIKKKWDINESWKLIAQMPFGKPTGAPKEKTFEPIEKRVKIFK